MTRLLTLASAIIAAVFLYSSPAAAQDKVTIGTGLISSQKCILCHSIGERGNKKGPLDGVGRKLKAEELRQWLTNPEEMRAKTKATRTPAMKDQKLTPEQLDALVAYLETLK
ncbi:MAG: cytochrome c [Acidobacteria bacterium]|nr:cytochrome c [Acidobacteriota bacterium]